MLEPVMVLRFEVSSDATPARDEASEGGRESLVSCLRGGAGKSRFCFLFLVDLLKMVARERA